jgi:hypothetical protein
VGKVARLRETAILTQKYPTLSLFVRDGFYQGMNYGLVDAPFELSDLVENFASGHDQATLGNLEPEIISFLQIERSEKVLIKELWALGADDFPKGESMVLTLQEIAKLAGRLHKNWVSWNRTRLQRVQEAREQDAAWRLSQRIGDSYIYDKSKPKMRKS